jgi:hypothetical protein
VLFLLRHIVRKPKNGGYTCLYDTKIFSTAGYPDVKISLICRMAGFPSMMGEYDSAKDMLWGELTAEQVHEVKLVLIRLNAMIVERK